MHTQFAREQLKRLKLSFYKHKLRGSFRKAVLALIKEKAPSFIGAVRYVR